MARHPSASRVRRQRKPKPDEAVVVRAFEFGAWAQRHSRVLIGVAAALLVIVLGAAYYITRRKALNATAEARLAEVQQTAASGNAPLAIKDLETFLGRYGSTVAGIQGKLLLGRLYLEQSRSSKALDVLKNLHPDDDLFATSRLLLLGAAYEQARDTAAAIDAYMAAGNGNGFLYQREQGLEDAARLRMESGDAASAAKLYQQLIDLASGNVQQQAVYEMRLGEAEAVEQTSQPAKKGN
jgi:tetratricopeptide (TPR) repeat protein